MNKTDTKQRCKEIVRESSRKAGLVKTSLIMEILPDLLDGITLDKSFVLGAIGNELNKATANPFNLILELFGLRIIHTQNTIQNIDGSMNSVSSYSIEDSGTVDTSNLLYLYETSFANVSNIIAKKLSDFEKDTESTTNFLKSQNAVLHTQLEKSENECSQVSSDYDGNIKSVADRVQYILSQIGLDETSVIFKQMNELLEDLGLHAVWYSSDEVDALFMVLKCSDPDKHKEKPCILCGDKVVSKGVIFTFNETIEVQN